MYGRSDVNVKVERGSTFTFTRGLSYIVSILFTHVKPVKVYVRTHVKITRQWKSYIALLPGKLNFHESTKLARNSPFAASKRKHSPHKSLKSSEFRQDKTVKATYN